MAHQRNHFVEGLRNRIDRLTIRMDKGEFEAADELRHLSYCLRVFHEIAMERVLSTAKTDEARNGLRQSIMRPGHEHLCHDWRKCR